MKKILSLSLIASALLVADTDLDLLKEQVAKQQSMINTLLQKIEKIEVKKASQNKPMSKKQTFAQSAYMPNVSLIADMSFVSRSVDNDALSGLEIPGVAHGIMGSHDHDGSSHAPYNADKGFNLNYAELGLSGSIDQNFKVDSIFHFSEDNVEIEELYFTATPTDGTKIKGGKFKSDFGYMNNQHHHYWSFADNALVYEAFLGTHGINEIGAQFQWTAPTDTYLMVGAEVLQGENEQMFGNKSIHLTDLNTSNTDVEATDAPSMFVAYVKSSVDIGDTSILGGLSYAKGKTRVDHSEDEDHAHAIAGDSTLYGVDLTVKHYFDSYSFLTWQSEILKRKMQGTEYDIDADTGAATPESLTKEQTGFYTQLIYAPNKTWQMGARYDSIYQNDVIIDGANENKPDDMKQYSAMIQYNASEFARLRLQYNQNRALYGEVNGVDTMRKVNSIMLQANFAMGAHGAHSF